MIREPIYAALFNKLIRATGITTASRKLKHWSEVPPSQQPALFLTQPGETAMPVRGVPSKWKARAQVYVYVNTAHDPSVVPAQVLNPLLDAIEAALAPEVNGFQTLNGLVVNAWISGEITTDEGTLGDQAVALIPIEMDVV